MKINVHLEAFLRILGVFLSVFFTVKWTSDTNPPLYDFPLTVISVLAAILLNYL
jgi:hypothetical protein